MRNLPRYFLGALVALALGTSIPAGARSSEAAQNQKKDLLYQHNWLNCQKACSEPFNPCMKRCYPTNEVCKTQCAKVLSRCNDACGPSPKEHFKDKKKKHQ